MAGKPSTKAINRIPINSKSEDPSSSPAYLSVYLHDGYMIGSGPPQNKYWGDRICFEWHLVIALSLFYLICRSPQHKYKRGDRILVLCHLVISFVYIKCHLSIRCKRLNKGILFRIKNGKQGKALVKNRKNRVGSNGFLQDHR